MEVFDWPGDLLITIAKQLPLIQRQRFVICSKQTVLLSKRPELWEFCDFSKLSLRSNSIDDDAFTKLMPCIRHAKILNLRYCQNIKASSLIQFSQVVGPQLHSLAITFSDKDVLTMLAKVAPNLHVLHLYPACRFNAPLFEPVARQLTQLTQLCVSSKFIRDAEFIFPITTLKHLDMSSCYRIKSQEWVQFATRVTTSITELSLMYSTCVSTIALETLLKRLGGGLRMLNLRGDHLLDNRAAQAIAMYCTSLRALNIYACSRINDLTVWVNLAPNLQNLEFLDIGFLSNAVTDDILYALASNCTQLTSLNIAGARRVTNNGVGALTQLKQLSLLDLTECTRLTPAIKDIFASLSKLDTISLRLNKKLDDSVLLEIATHCPLIRRLDLSECNFTDYGISFLLETRPQIFRLNINANKVTNQIVNIIDSTLEYRTKCKYEDFFVISVCGCFEINKQQFNALRAKYGTRLHCNCKRMAMAEEGPNKRYNCACDQFLVTQEGTT